MKIRFGMNFFVLIVIFLMLNGNNIQYSNFQPKASADLSANLEIDDATGSLSFNHKRGSQEIEWVWNGVVLLNSGSFHVGQWSTYIRGIHHLDNVYNVIDASLYSSTGENWFTKIDTCNSIVPATGTTYYYFNSHFYLNRYLIQSTGTNTYSHAMPSSVACWVSIADDQGSSGDYGITGVFDNNLLSLNLFWELQPTISIDSDYYNKLNTRIEVYDKTTASWMGQSYDTLFLRHPEYKVRIYDSLTNRLIFEDTDYQKFKYQRTITIKSVSITNNYPSSLDVTYYFLTPNSQTMYIYPNLDRYYTGWAKIPNDADPHYTKVDEEPYSTADYVYPTTTTQTQGFDHTDISLSNRYGVDIDYWGNSVDVNGYWDYIASTLGITAEVSVNGGTSMVASIAWSITADGYKTLTYNKGSALTNTEVNAITTRFTCTSFTSPAYLAQERVSFTEYYYDYLISYVDVGQISIPPYTTYYFAEEDSWDYFLFNADDQYSEDVVTEKLLDPLNTKTWSYYTITPPLMRQCVIQYVDQNGQYIDFDRFRTWIGGNLVSQTYSAEIWDTITITTCDLNNQTIESNNFLIDADAINYLTISIDMLYIYNNAGEVINVTIANNWFDGDSLFFYDIGLTDLSNWDYLNAEYSAFYTPFDSTFTGWTEAESSGSTITYRESKTLLDVTHHDVAEMWDATVASSASLTKTTLYATVCSAWIATSDNQKTAWMDFKRQDGTRVGRFFVANAGYVQWYKGSNVNLVAATANTWYHLLAQFIPSTNKVKIWVNNMYITEETLENNFASSSDTIKTVAFATYPLGVNELYTAYFDSPYFGTDLVKGRDSYYAYISPYARFDGTEDLENFAGDEILPVYNSVYNFESDTVGSFPSDTWYKSSSVTASVVDSKDRFQNTLKVTSISSVNANFRPLSIGSVPLTGTIEWWQRAGQTNAVMYSSSSYDTGHNLMVYWKSNGKIAGYNGGSLTEIADYVANQWYHICIQFDQRHVIAASRWYNIYIDGVLEADHFAYKSDQLVTFYQWENGADGNQIWEIDGFDYSWATGYWFGRNRGINSTAFVKDESSITEFTQATTSITPFSQATTAITPFSQAAGVIVPFDPSLTGWTDADGAGCESTYQATALGKSNVLQLNDTSTNAARRNGVFAGTVFSFWIASSNVSQYTVCYFYESGTQMGIVGLYNNQFLWSNSMFNYFSTSVADIWYYVSVQFDPSTDKVAIWINYQYVAEYPLTNPMTTQVTDVYLMTGSAHVNYLGYFQNFYNGNSVAESMNAKVDGYSNLDTYKCVSKYKSYFGGKSNNLELYDSGTTGQAYTAKTGISGKNVFAFFLANTDTTKNTLVYFYEGANMIAYLYTQSGYLTFRYVGGSTDNLITLANNVWTHFTIQFDASTETAHIWVDQLYENVFTVETITTGITSVNFVTSIAHTSFSGYISQYYEGTSVAEAMDALINTWIGANGYGCTSLYRSSKTLTSVSKTNAIEVQDYSASYNGGVQRFDFTTSTVFSFWIATSDITKMAYVPFYESSTRIGYFSLISSARWYNGATQIVYDPPYSANTWVHVTLQFSVSDDTVNIWIDKVWRGQYTLENPITTGITRVDMGTSGASGYSAYFSQFYYGTSVSEGFDSKLGDVWTYSDGLGCVTYYDYYETLSSVSKINNVIFSDNSATARCYISKTFTSFTTYSFFFATSDSTKSFYMHGMESGSTRVYIYIDNGILYDQDFSSVYNNLGAISNNVWYHLTVQVINLTHHCVFLNEIYIGTYTHRTPIVTSLNGFTFLGINVDTGYNTYLSKLYYGSYVAEAFDADIADGWTNIDGSCAASTYEENALNRANVVRLYDNSITTSSKRQKTITSGSNVFSFWIASSDTIKTTVVLFLQEANWILQFYIGSGNIYECDRLTAHSLGTLANNVWTNIVVEVDYTTDMQRVYRDGVYINEWVLGIVDASYVNNINFYTSQLTTSFYAYLDDFYYGTSKAEAFNTEIANYTYLDTYGGVSTFSPLKNAKKNVVSLYDSNAVASKGCEISKTLNSETDLYISFWVRNSDASKGVTFRVYKSASLTTTYFYMNGDKWYYYDGAGYDTGLPAPLDNTWYHIILHQSASLSTVFQLWINGLYSGQFNTNDDYTTAYKFNINTVNFNADGYTVDISEIYYGSSLSEALSSYVYASTMSYDVPTTTCSNFYYQFDAGWDTSSTNALLAWSIDESPYNAMVMQFNKTGLSFYRYGATTLYYALSGNKTLQFYFDMAHEQYQCKFGATTVTIPFFQFTTVDYATMHHGEFTFQFEGVIYLDEFQLIDIWHSWLVYPYSSEMSNYTVDDYIVAIEDIYGNDLEAQVLLSTDNEIVYTPDETRQCFVALFDQQSKYLDWEQFKLYKNDELMYTNVFYGELGTDWNISVYDRFDQYIESTIHTVERDDNYISIQLTMYSLKVYNQQLLFNFVNITRDPNYYATTEEWTEWSAPNEIIDFRLFAGYYKIAIESNENDTSLEYAYTLNGDDILLLTSQNTIAMAISNIENVNTTIGNQITAVNISISNTQSQINNSIVMVNISIDNINSTLGDQLLSIDTSLTVLNSTIDTLFADMESAVFLVNNSIYTGIVGLGTQLELVNNSIAGNLTFILQMNPELSAIYTNCLFSKYLNWTTDLAEMYEQFDYYTIFNNNTNDALRIYLKYQNETVNMEVAAQDTINLAIKNTDTFYRLYSIEHDEYLDEWKPLPLNKTISVGYYDEIIPATPEDIILELKDYMMIGLFGLFIAGAATILYIKARNEGNKKLKSKLIDSSAKGSPSIFLSEVNKQKYVSQRAVSIRRSVTLIIATTVCVVFLVVYILVEVGMR